MRHATPLGKLRQCSYPQYKLRARSFGPLFFGPRAYARPFLRSSISTPLPEPVYKASSLRSRDLQTRVGLRATHLSLAPTSWSTSRTQPRREGGGSSMRSGRVERG